MKNRTEGTTTAQATKDEEIIMVRTQDGSMEDVRKISDSDLCEIHRTHLQFLESLIFVTTEALTCSDVSGIEDHIPNLVIEIDSRFTYLKEIGHEMRRRLRSQERKTA